MVIIGVLLIFVSGFLFVMEVFMDDMYHARYEVLMGNFYETFEEDYMKVTDKRAYMREREKELKAFVTVFAEDYKVLESTSPEVRFTNAIPKHMRLDIDVLHGLEEKEYRMQSYYDQLMESDMIYLVGRISDNEYILIEKSLNEVQEASEIVTSILMVTILSVLLIGFVIAYYASYLVTKPILLIKTAVTGIANLDFDHQLNIKNKDEIGDLGKTINVISEELKSTVEEIKLKNKLLDEDKKELEKMNDELKMMSKTDHLTKLSNRLEIDRILDHEKERAGIQGSTFSIILIDIDHFKRVNDTYGHPVGDRVLIHISNIMKDLSRRLDTVGRWGGEEFIIVLPDTLLEDAATKAETIRKIISETVFDTVGHLTVSLGVVQYRENMKLSDMFSSVDEALYKAKENGRNRIEIVLKEQK